MGFVFFCDFFTKLANKIHFNKSYVRHPFPAAPRDSTGYLHLYFKALAKAVLFAALAKAVFRSC
jgi:hypothetical protein